MNFKEFYEQSKAILNELEPKIKTDKWQIITLINAQFMLRFSNNYWYFEEKIITYKYSNEEVLYTLKTIDLEWLILIKNYFKN